MTPLPQALIDSLQHAPGFDRAAFEAVHRSGEQVTSIRINPAKPLPGLTGDLSDFTTAALIEAPVPWSSYGYYLRQRPSFTFDPFFHAGNYYVQEASSMFLEQALKQGADLAATLKVLDLCAAPGGKSTHIQSLLSPGSLLVSNEVIRARASVLQQNIIKWGAANVVVTSNDPQHFARLEGFFDVIVADAPCSGSGLFRRDPALVREWSTDAVQLCCGRQQRILHDVLPALKEGGLLIYSTCSYSVEEDEQVIDELLAQHQVEPVDLDIPAAWNIVAVTTERGGKGYRFYPDKLKGEGFFLCCLRKTSGADFRYKKGKTAERLTAKETQWLDPWMETKDLHFYRHEDRIYALPSAMEEAYAAIRSALYIQHAGLHAGSLIRNKLVPDHALALSPLLSPNVPSTTLDAANAIRYLQRQEIDMHPGVKGWQTVRFQGESLGWINALPNRINNYYPKELRILKQGPDPSSEQ